MVAELAEETDYDNFKSEVAHYRGKAGADYEYALHDVWSVVNRLQTQGRDGGIGNRPASP